MLLLSKLSPALTRNPALIPFKNADFLTPAVNRLGTIVNTWIQIDAETRRSAYELSKIFAKRLEISKIKKTYDSYQEIKEPIVHLCRSVATNANNFIEAKTSSFSAEAEAAYVTEVFA